MFSAMQKVKDAVSFDMGVMFLAVCYDGNLVLIAECMQYCLLWRAKGAPVKMHGFAPAARSFATRGRALNSSIVEFAS